MGSTYWRANGNDVRLYTRNGTNFADRFPRIVAAVKSLPVQSCFIDGDVVDQRGLSAFDLLRSWRHDRAAVLCAFDLIELDGKDLRHAPLLSFPNGLEDQRAAVAFEQRV